MSRNNKSERQSSLPSSLIPLLYSGPQPPRDSSTRTTLPPGSEEEEPIPDDTPTTAFHFRPIRAPSPITSSSTGYLQSAIPRRREESFELEPQYPERRSILTTSMTHSTPVSPIHIAPIRDEPFYNSSPAGRHYVSYSVYQPPSPYWREGDAGPSMPPQSSASGRETGQSYAIHPEPVPRYGIRRRHGTTDAYPREDREDFREISPQVDISSQQHYREISGGQGRMDEFSSHLTLPPLTVPSRGERTGRESSSGRSSGTGDFSRYSPMPSSRPFGSGEFDDKDDDYAPTKRIRRTNTEEESDEPPPKPASKKTLIACDFCRGRKLRCDGKKPKCYNCKGRDEQDCVYQTHARRRGPGKAPKEPKGMGSTTPRRQRHQSGRASSQPETMYQPEFEYERFPPEFRTQGPSRSSSQPGTTSESSSTPQRQSRRRKRKASSSSPEASGSKK
ncbi:hypothetical protein C8J56DRAFT_1074026 [Mycena floridula]|nr:hypothetical protein C8J56DRAFT_1074026 [Mycena floridula]